MSASNRNDTENAVNYWNRALLIFAAVATIGLLYSVYDYWAERRTAAVVNELTTGLQSAPWEMWISHVIPKLGKSKRLEVLNLKIKGTEERRIISFQIPFDGGTRTYTVGHKQLTVNKENKKWIVLEWRSGGSDGVVVLSEYMDEYNGYSWETTHESGWETRPPDNRVQLRRKL